MKFVSVMTSGSSGGAEFAAVNMLEALSKYGHEAVLLTNSPGVAAGRDVLVRSIELGPKLSRSSYLKLGATSPLLLQRLRRQLDAEAPYDVLIMHFKKEQLLSAMLPHRLRRRLVWTEWGPVPRQMTRFLGRVAYLTAARRAEMIFAVSAGTRDSVQTVGVPSEKVHVVPNALSVELARYSPEGRKRIRSDLGIPLEALVVGCVSRFHRKKRNDVAVDAVAALHRDDVHLIMAGEGEEEATLRRLAEPLGGRAHFVPTPGPEIARVCSAFDLSVFCPSPTEGAPLAVIHSMLVGRPCIATGDEGVSGLIVPGTGTIVAPEHDVAALTAVLKVYLGDAERRTREGRAAREFAEKMFAAPAVANRIELLLGVASGDREPPPGAPTGSRPNAPPA